MRNLLVTATLILAALLPAAVLAEQPALPPDVTNLFDAETSLSLLPIGEGALFGNPDFPVVLLRNLAHPGPSLIMIVVDARNGKETWTLGEDPIVLVLLGYEAPDKREAYVDEGFLTQGSASGQFVALDTETPARMGDAIERGLSLARPQTLM